MQDTLIATAAAAASAMIGLWLLSLLRRDASIVDVWWGPGYALIAWVAFAVGAQHRPRALLVAALATAWGLRLGSYLLWRNWGEEEDYRYQAMRRHWGARFPWVSLVTVFLLQGALMWVVSLALQIAAAAPQPARLGLTDAAGSVLVLGGLIFEGIADLQLARFRSRPANRGKVLDRGLWSLSRHPNYFGDAVVWWGFFVLALGTEHGAWALVSPLVMTFLLLRVSGVTLLERRLQRSKPEYEEYRRRTNAFFPGPKKS